MLQRRVFYVTAMSFLAVACAPRKFNSAQIEAARPGSPSDCGNPGQPGAANPVHCPGDITIDGPWGYDETALTNNGWWNRGARPFVPGLFGATVILGPNGAPLTQLGTATPYVIRDQHYHLGNGKVGIRPIPYAEPGTTEYTGSGEPIQGPSLLDAALRTQYGLPAGAPVWGISICNLDGDPIIDVTKLGDRVRGRAGHVGMYIGNGYSRHQNGGGGGLHLWGPFIRGQPQTVLGVSIQGVDQATLNANLVAMSRILTEFNQGFDDNFPMNHKNDPVGQVSLRQMLDIFRSWILGGAEIDKLKNSADFAMFCAELANVALNLGLNVPLTERYFTKIWGATEGPRLWQRLQERIKAEDQSPMYPDEGSKLADAMPKADFVPLWERDQVTNPRQLIKPGASMAWPLETTGDAIAGAVETFGNFPAFGPMPSIAILMGTLSVAQQRTGVSTEQYMRYVIPAAAKIVKHFAPLAGIKSDAQWEGYLQMAIPQQMRMPELMAAVNAIKNDAFALQHRTQAEAWAAFEKDVAPEVAAYRSFEPVFSMFEQQNLQRLGRDFLQQRRAAAQAAGNAPAVARLDRMLASVDAGFYHKYNANPILFLRVAQGMRNSHPNVKVIPIGTAFHPSLLKSKTAGAKASYSPADRALLGGQ